MVKTDVLRFEVKYSDDRTWAIVDNHNDSLPFAWFIREDTANTYCDYQNNNYYFPF